MKSLRGALALLLALCLLGGAAGAEEKRLHIYTSHKPDVYQPLIDEFEARTGVLGHGGNRRHERAAFAHRVGGRTERRRPDVWRRRGESGRVQSLFRIPAGRFRRSFGRGVPSGRRVAAVFVAAHRDHLPETAHGRSRAERLGGAFNGRMARADRLRRPDGVRLQLYGAGDDARRAARRRCGDSFGVLAQSGRAAAGRLGRGGRRGGARGFSGRRHAGGNGAARHCRRNGRRNHPPRGGHQRRAGRHRADEGREAPGERRGVHPLRAERGRAKTFWAASSSAARC